MSDDPQARGTGAAAAAASSPGPGEALTERLGMLCELLRQRGVRVGTGEFLAAHRALVALPDPGDVLLARVALRATLCSAHAHLEAFEDAWQEWQHGARAESTGAAAPPELDDAMRSLLPRTLVPSASSLTRVEEMDPVPAAWSDAEVLLGRDFAGYEERDRAAALALLRRGVTRGPQRRSRRLVPSPRGRRIDLRSTMRASWRTGGEPFVLRRSGHRLEPRPLVLIADVSGSMAPYATMLLAYMQATVTGRRRVEAFAFATRLTRITHELRGRDPEAALGRAHAALHDARGGTRIGEAMSTLNREYGRVIGRGSVVILLSDGWDRGDPELLGHELARLRRCAHRLIWLNPLAADPRWEPLTRGMVAASPHLDRILPGNSLRSLRVLADLIEREDL
ncbi:MAG TPA: VWA domain-containing protein [Solirubrobacteraceae bacterium]|nr:VWA domain-containing protein [Solirubrobacteraceae bacterium]